VKAVDFLRRQFELGQEDRKFKRPFSRALLASLGT
jgi:hypothetical protein